MLPPTPLAGGGKKTLYTSGSTRDARWASRGFSSHACEPCSFSSVGLEEEEARRAETKASMPLTPSATHTPPVGWFLSNLGRVLCQYTLGALMSKGSEEGSGADEDEGEDEDVAVGGPERVRSREAT
jgi:hypothetical protein